MSWFVLVGSDVSIAVSGGKTVKISRHLFSTIVFDEDLKRGNEAEERLCRSLPLLGFTNPRRVSGYFPDYDIETDRGTFEVKRDFESKRTGNFFFEYRYKGELSGISKTKAIYFAVLTENLAYIALTRNVKDFLRQHWKIYEHKKKSGDNGQSEGILVPIGHYTSTRVVGLEELRI